jgi:16S rRNA pseudouridine516 synthase
VTTKHTIDEKQVSELLKGVQLVDEQAPIAALDCKQIGDNIIHLTLAEGKYHQVKRMLAAISNRVEGLKRIRIGELNLPEDLAVGQWRWLDAAALVLLNQQPSNEGTSA